LTVGKIIQYNKYIYSFENGEDKQKLLTVFSPKKKVFLTKRWREMKKAKKVIGIILAAVLTIAAILCVAACEDKETAAPTVTLTFVCDGETSIEPITAAAGSEITAPADPHKDGFVFRGWYETSDFSGEPVALPAVMPQENKTYYAHFVTARTLTYEYNLNDVQHGNSIAADIAGEGETVTVKDGAMYEADGYLFMGWSTEENGLVYPTGTKNEGQYNAGEEIILDTDLTLYAQWAKGYDAGKNEKVFLYSPLIGKGQGAAIYVNAQDEKKFGFAENDANGFTKIEFYYDEGTKEGRLYEDGLFLFCDGLTGNYLRYDYVTQKSELNILALDGYGNATYSTIVGSQTRVDLFGWYIFDAEYGDYTFIGIDPQTGKENDEGFYFSLGEKTTEGFTGEFIVQGGESGSYMMYDNGELSYDRLDLNGYGTAKRYAYDMATESFILVSESIYKGTENYTGAGGEWETSENSQTVRFVLNIVSGSSGDVPVFIEFDAAHAGDLTGENGDTLYLDGYGNARYTQSGGTEFEGVCSFKNALITFIPYVEDGDGVHAGGKLYFTVDWQNKTFTVNDTGYVTDGNVLVAYEGDATVIIIPDGVTEIANDVFKGKDILSVTIPASVQVIGARAFENEYTLTRAIFLSKTPITMDWAKETCPFRWPSNSFVIVVPEESVEAYKTAWSDCPYTIKGSEEAAALPEFEVDHGVLVRYNKPSGASDAYTITIPDGVTEIADFVFRGFTFITGVDLAGVTAIGEGAFAYCENLQTVTARNVERIGIGAFEYCVSLGTTDGTVELPRIVSIGANAFQGCEKIKFMRLGETLANIDERAFCECHIYEDEDPLFIELSGTTPPVMGEKVFIGNIAVRIKVTDIDVALACFNEPTFNAYCRHLYIESGSEKGLYIDGADTLELDGRAVLMKSTLMLYAIENNIINFYEYDAETATYTSLTGLYEEGKITVRLDNVSRTFVKAGETITYTSTDGLYTLICKPADIDPETYADTGYAGYATVTLNGTEVQLQIKGFTVKKILNYLDTDQKRYDLTITIMPGNLFSYEKETAESYVRNITAPDGSVLNLHYLGKSVYVFGTLEIDVGDGTILPEWSDYGTLAAFTSANECTFTRMYKNTTYRITVTFAADRKTFTYTYEIG